MRAWREQTKAQSGLSRKDASYWFCVLLIGQYIFFILLRRHIFVFFTRILFFLSLMCSLLLACCYLVAHIVGLGAGANVFGAGTASEVAALKREGSQVLVIEPDTASATAIGLNPLDPATREPSAMAGRTQGRELAVPVAALWSPA